MGRRKNKEQKSKVSDSIRVLPAPFAHISIETKKSLNAIFFITAALVVTLSFFGLAGAFGMGLLHVGVGWFGWGFYTIPVILMAMAGAFLWTLHSQHTHGTGLSGALLFVSILGVLQLLHPNAGGVVGGAVASIKNLFGFWASMIILLSLFLSSLIIMFDIPLFVHKPKEDQRDNANVPPVTPSDVMAVSQPPSITPPVVSGVGAAKGAHPAEENKEKEDDMSSSFPQKTHMRKQVMPAVKSDYVLPPLDLLEAESTKPIAGDIKAQANIITRTLEKFGIPVEIGEVNIGSSVTRYAVKPAEGVKLSKITNLHNDLALALAAHPVRIEAPIPGKSLVGIEVPNKASMIVRLKNLLQEKTFQESNLLSFAIGRDVTGEAVVANLAKMPHLLVAGATGSGKSITIHAFMTSLLFKNAPDTLRFILIDPKRVELSVYNEIPHLVAPVITDGKRAVMSLKWAVQEMEQRYQMLLEEKTRDIDAYNEKMALQKKEFMPYIIIVIDELADLMASFGKVVEAYIVRLAQMSRAVGIHLVVSTQRPSVDVITGLIKANIPSRIALQVVSQIDSRTILDTMGAEKLLGNGDMLYLAPDASKPKRLQGVYVSDEEVKRLVGFWIKQKVGGGEVSGLEQVLRQDKSNNDTIPGGVTSSFVDFDSMGNDDEANDDMYDQALQVVREAKKASASLLQRRLRVGYARAARLLDLLENKGIIGPGDGAKPREVYVDTVDNSVGEEDSIL
ncbi:MAG: DNA translocase FtsK [Patescibacteria group bacterium]|nr:DNA translocase FtsK [Patescibacteria group bacterium]MDE2438020.1 DNA translocase FtsK [Patescibacteria group bacterium]